MPTVTDHRLPGITFEVVPPPLPDTLPRMDVAGFVGFASSGPVDVPVVVDDVARFRDVFGPDVALARDPSSGTWLWSHLGVAVEEFLRGGGRRCWVVRVAGPDAEVARFPLPGLVGATDAVGGLQDAELTARAVGDWADELSVAASLVPERLPAVTVAEDVPQLTVHTKLHVQPGDLLRLTIDGGARTELLVVADVRTAIDGTTQVTYDGRLRLDADGIVGTPHLPPHVTGDETPVPVIGSLGGSLVVAERLRLTLSVYEDDRLQAQLDGLAFDARHPDHWAHLPDDETLFARHGLRAGTDGRGIRPPGAAESQLPALWDRVTSPRFPLAAPSGLAGTWFPIAVGDLATPDVAVPTTSPTAAEDRRRRAGLTTFDPAVFTDPALHQLPHDGLGAAVDARANLPAPPRFRGVHALFPLDEVTIVAVPDAGHAPWHVRVEEGEPPPDAPVLRNPAPEAGQLAVWWTPIDAAARYVLEEGSSVDLTPARRQLDGEAEAAGPDGTVGARLPSPPCASLRVLRVRAVLEDGRTSPWSNTVTVIDPPTTFVDAERDDLPAPGLVLEESEDEGEVVAEQGRLTWSAPDGAMLPTDVRVEVERSTDPLFTTSQRPDVGDAAELELPPPGDEHAFYRARYLDETVGRSGPWSMTVVQLARPREVLESDPPLGEVAPDLLRVQRALLRFAAGRGDVLALLSLPAWYRAPETLAHLATLRGLDPDDAVVGGLAPTAPLDDRLLANAAVVAPWTSVRTTQGVRSVPPCGGMAGVVARRTIERGAWISPGHQPLAGVVALRPDLEKDDRARLTAAAVNLLERRPTGVVPVSAVTLVEDPMLRPIEVRRLLHLLRRLALRHGDLHVFEPNSHAFRRKVQRTFQRILGDLFERGAFAGQRPDEGFQVVADHTVNPPSAVDAGRFVVELRVAPTRPMTFLRVRLVQTGPGDPIAVEVAS